MLTGTPFFDFILMGAGAGGAGCIIVSIMQGNVPAGEVIPWAFVGAILGAVLFVFQSGMT